MATEVAVGYVSVVPNAKGFGDKLTADTAAPLAAAGTGMGSTLSKGMASSGAGMTKALTLPLIAVAAAAVGSALSVDNALSDIAKRTGATGAAADALGQSFRNVAGKTPADFKTTAAAIGEVYVQLGLTGQPLDDVSLKMIKLSRIAGVDVVEATDGVAKSMKAWNVPASGAAGYMDMLLKTSQTTGISLLNLTGGMQKYAGALTGFGFSNVQAAALLGTFDKAGINTQLAMTGLRMGMGKLAKAGETDLPGALNKTIEAIKGAKSPAEATGIAVKMFGARAGVDLAKAIREGRMELGPLVKNLTDSAGTIDNTAASASTLGGKWDTSINQMKIALEPLGQAGVELMTNLMPAFQKIGEVVGTLVGWFKDLPEPVRTVLAALLAVGVIAGPMMQLVSALKLMQVVMGVIKIATVAWTAVQWLLNMALNANPIGIIVLAVVALVAIIVLLWNKCDWFRNGVMAIWNGIQVAVGAVVGWFQTNVLPTLTNVWNWIVTGVTFLWKAFTTYWGFIFKVVSAVVSWFMTNVLPTLQTVWSWISTGISFLWQAFTTYWGFIFNIVRTVVEWIVANVWPKVQVAFEALKLGVMTVWNIVSKNFTMIKDIVTTVFNFFKDHIVSKVNAVIAIFNTVKEQVTTVINWFGGIRDTISKKVSGMWDGISAAFKGAINAVIRLWNNLSFTVPKIEKGGVSFGGWTIDTPDIGYLASGGTVLPQRGGTLAILAEAGRAETVVDTGLVNQRLAEMETAQRMPSTLVVVDADGALVGRMEVVADRALDALANELIYRNV